MTSYTFLNTLQKISAFMGLLLFLCFGKLSAQQTYTSKDSLPSKVEQLKDDVLSGLGSVKHTYTSPLRWKKKDFLIAGTIAAGTAALYIYDEETSDFFIKQKEHIPAPIKEFGWHGSPENYYALNSAVYLSGLLSGNEKLRKTGVLLVSSATASGLILAVGKTLIGRARPYTGQGKDHFSFFTSEKGYHAFPSGHSLMAFSTFYAVSKQFNDPYIKAGLIGLGLVGPVSRLWEGEHWLTDVTLSVLLGTVIVDSIDTYLNRKWETTASVSSRIHWDLQIGLGRIGITGSF